MDIQDRGLPSVFFATVEFVSGADAQAWALGAQASAVYVEHPIQAGTDEEMKGIADLAVEGVVKAIVAVGHP